MFIDDIGKKSTLSKRDANWLGQLSKNLYLDGQYTKAIYINAFVEHASDRTMIAPNKTVSVECTWGECADVLVCGTIPIINMKKVGGLDRFTHGICIDWQLDLTIDQAKKLASDLLLQAAQAEQLENAYDDVQHK